MNDRATIALRDRATVGVERSADEVRGLTVKNRESRQTLGPERAALKLIPAIRDRSVDCIVRICLRNLQSVSQARLSMDTDGSDR